jgi:hypothetical protein
MIKIALCDADGLYQSVGQAQATYLAQKAEMDAKNAAAADKTGISPNL